MADLTRSERAALLRLARSSIEDALVRARVLDGALEGVELTAALMEVRGAFVTLRDGRAPEPSGKGPLRGCIGTVDPNEPLYRNVIHNAARAAFEDPRFAPVATSELHDLKVEISALTPMTLADGIDAIVPGRDGVELETGTHRAVFLPQVAAEQGWDTKQLLENLARKAGLPPNGWRDAKLSTFRAEVFEEEPTD